MCSIAVVEELKVLWISWHILLPPLPLPRSPETLLNGNLDRSIVAEGVIERSYG